MLPRRTEPPSTVVGIRSAVHGHGGRLPTLARRVSHLLTLGCVLAGCGGAPDFQLVESWPAGTDLDDPAVPDTADVWLDMIDSADRKIEFGEFYGASRPGSRMEDVLAAVGRAAARGVRIRFLFDRVFHEKMPEVPDRLARVEGVEVRLLDLAALTGGVLHAKYFVVDGREAFLGSQNFDWRSLEHIQELGVRTRLPGLVAALEDVFEHDWALANGERPVAGDLRAARGPETASYGGASVAVTPVASPRDHLPPGIVWDLPRILALVNGARDRVRLQLLSYGVLDRDGSQWRELDDALLAAAHRGVKVELLLADWNKTEPPVSHLQGLARRSGVEVRLVTIPPDASGFIPYARVIHAKFLVVDAANAWLGTSNASREYFYESRNVGILVEGARFAADLDRRFERLWESRYAVPVDPDARYEVPRVALGGRGRILAPTAGR